MVGVSQVERCLSLSLVDPISHAATADDAGGPSSIAWSPRDTSLLERLNLSGEKEDPAENLRQALDMVTHQTGVPNIPAARNAMITKWKPRIDVERRKHLLAAYDSAFTQKDVDDALVFFRSPAGKNYVAKTMVATRFRLDHHLKDHDFQSLWSEYQVQVTTIQEASQKSDLPHTPPPYQSGF